MKQNRNHLWIILPATILLASHAAGQTGVVGWGDNTFGQTTIPTFSSHVTVISAGGYHNLALCDDGSVVAWGRGTEGETNVPASLSYPSAIAAGGYHSLALRYDGTVLAWGAGTNSTGINNNFGQSIVPPGLSNVKAIAAGFQHSLALKYDGTVVAWGDNQFGQTNVPAGLSNVVAITAGSGYHSLALRADGTVVAWGWNNHGQTNVPASVNDVEIPDPNKLARQVPYLPGTIAAGGFHSLSLNNDGSVAGWGTNVLGAATIPSGLINPYSIAAGYSHSLAMRSNGTVQAWGDNSSGQTSVPSGLADVVMVAAGKQHSLVLTSCAPFIQNITWTKSLVPDGFLFTFCATVQGAAPLSYAWETNGNYTPVSTTSGCFSWFVSGTDNNPDYPSSPYLLLDINNGCGRDFAGVFVPTCAICLSRGTPNLLTGTSGSGSGPPLTNGCGVLSANSRWYKMVATNDTGMVTLSTEGSTIKTAVGVYSGSLDSLNPVACTGSINATNQQSRMAFNAVQGTVYWFVVDPGTYSASNLRLGCGFQPRIASYGMNPDGSFRLQSTPAAPIPYNLLSTTNFALNVSNWSVVLATNLTTNFPYLYYRDTNVKSSPRRFYRLAP